MTQSSNQLEVPLPHDMEMERAVLFSLLMDPGAVHQFRDRLKPEHFYTRENRKVYNAILDVSARGLDVDTLTVTEALNAKHPDAKHPDRWLLVVSALMDTAASYWNLESYVAVVEDKFIRRRMIHASQRLFRGAMDQDGNAAEKLTAAEEELLTLRVQGEKELESPQEVGSRWLSWFETQRANGHRPGDLGGIGTGLIDLDRLLDGLQRGQQNVIAARPGMGKTALALAIAHHMVFSLGLRIAFVSLEMSERQIVNRLIPLLISPPAPDVKHPWDIHEDHVPRVYDAIGRLSESGFYIDTSSSPRPSDIRARCLRLQARGGLDAVFVDYLHLMTPERTFPRPDLEVGENARLLAVMYKDLDVAGVTMSQLSRAVENRADKRPHLADLRESGQIEEHAFSVLMLYRDEYYEKEMTERPNILEVGVEKHRDGPTGQVDLFWHSRLATVRNLKRERISL